MKSIIKIISLEIANIKNVGRGTLHFDNKDEKMNILGVYGQNGSGKTTLIKAVEILKSMLSGEDLPFDLADYIRINYNSASIKALFEISCDSDSYKVGYEFTISRFEGTKDATNARSYIISSEKISYSKKTNDEWSRNSVIFNYDLNEQSTITPNKNYSALVKAEKDAEVDMKLMLRNQINYPKSIYFSSRFWEILNKSELSDDIKKIFIDLRRYGMFYIMICDNEKNGIVNANISIPFQFLLNKNDSDELLTGGISLMKRSPIPNDIYLKVENNIKKIGKVISELVPNLSIELHKYGETFDKNGQKMIEAELLSIRNGIPIPMKLESDGIKKIISILACLIVAYNNNSVFLAVDELDSGIFEFLLGEMLEVFYKAGKGQLLFTSHNFRALEVLGKHNIVLTTTNENNKYIKFKNIKPNNNMRDVFYHDLMLGGQAECLYEPTNVYRISSSFRRAGDFIE